MKRNLVKLMAFALASVSVASLASCGETQQPGQKQVEINVWATAAEEAVINKVVANYNEGRPADEQFKVKFTPVAEGDCGVTLSKDPTVDGAPALFLCADDHIADLTSKNIIAELKGARREKIEAENTDVAVLGVTQNGSVWGYPVTSDNGYFMWYDKSQVDANTVGNLEAAADPRYTEHVSIGGAAFVKQSAFACVQSQTAEGRYWDIGKAIGQAYIDSNLNGETWAQFLKGQMDTIRKPQI